MIKITKPIELKNKKIVSGLGDSLYNRITAGYEIMNAQIEAKDLLHMVTEPPEVFLAEGDQYNIFNQNVSIENTQSQKLDIINNLINRIAISQTDKLTYQDNVYISTVLRKLGITDVSQFMHQVQSIISENNNVRSQLSILNENLNQYMRIEDGSQPQQGYVKASDTTEGRESNSYYLHQEIFNRLHTREIYETVAAFSKTYKGDVVSYEQLSLAEQIRTENHLHLQELQNQITGEALPLIYAHENYYEEDVLTEEAQTVENHVSSQLTQAVLLSIVDKLYEVKGNDIHTSVSQWYQVSNSLQNIAENTIQRYSQNLSSPIYNETKQRMIEAEIKNTEVLRESLENVQVMSEADQIYESLVEINKRNEANYNQYINAMQRLDERLKDKAPVARGVDVARQRRESLMALSDPSALMETYQNEGSRPEVKTISRDEQQFVRELPPAMREYLDIVNQVIEQERAKGGSQTEQLMAELTADIRELEQEKEKRREQAQGVAQINNASVREETSQAVQRVIDNRLTESITQLQGTRTDVELILPQTGEAAIDLDTDTGHMDVSKGVSGASRAHIVTEEAADQIINKVINKRTIKNHSEQVESVRNKELSLVHKENETINEEEIVERISELRQNVVEEKNIVNEVHQETNLVNHQEITRQVVNELTDSGRIQGIVSKNIQDQLSGLSDQVFARLERRLENEKRRRGI